MPDWIKYMKSDINKVYFKVLGFGIENVIALNDPWISKAVVKNK